jgi:hypothetical protein
MDLTKRLAFKGWTTIEANSGLLASEIAVDKFKVNISEYIADRDYIFYPLYVEESVYSKPTEDKYFKLVKDLGNGECVLGVNDNYKLRGKITIPSTYNDLVVASLQQFQNATNASHIFFMEDS